MNGKDPTTLSIMNLSQDCERCHTGRIVAVVSSPNMNMQVCIMCAQFAIALQTPENDLDVKPIVWM